MGTSSKSLKSGMGVEIIEKDENYIVFIESSLS
jgi:hypothetical protein